jgi:hypothetical protein
MRASSSILREKQTSLTKRGCFVARNTVQGSFAANSSWMRALAPRAAQGHPAAVDWPAAVSVSVFG